MHRLKYLHLVAKQPTAAAAILPDVLIPQKIKIFIGVHLMPSVVTIDALLVQPILSMACAID